MKSNVIAMAVAAAMLSFGAVAQEKKEGAELAVGHQGASRLERDGQRFAPPLAVGQRRAARAPVCTGDKQSQRAAGASDKPEEKKQ